MINPFKRANVHIEQAAQEPTTKPRRSADHAWMPYVPASAVGPEKQRLAIYDESDEESDEELEFLSELAAQVDRQQQRQTPPRRRHAPPLVQTVAAPTDEEKLNVFRELQDRIERGSLTDRLPLQHVEMSDLLDDLQTTAAALRRRRAA